MYIGEPNLEVEQGDTCDMETTPPRIDGIARKRTYCGAQAIASYQSKQWYFCLPCALEAQSWNK